MTLALLLPALAVLAALIALTVGLKQVDSEIAALRRSLARSAAAGVAADELRRTTAVVAERAVVMGEDTRHRFRRHRIGRRDRDR